MDNDIIKLLGLKESGINILSVKETTKTRTVALEKVITAHYCPACGCRMYSKGVYRRKVNHPIMQDGLQLILEIHQRRWQCINPSCRQIETDEFSFVDKHRRNTSYSDLLIVNAFRDPCASASQIARRFHVSDTHAITTFARYVDMPRRGLTEAICIDEVYLNISRQYRYALVIQDFITGEPIDMVPSRRHEVTKPYFASVPIGERRNVRYVITDMYGPYLAYPDKYFPNAISVIDAFHVIKFINNEFLKYIRSVLRRIDQEDRFRHELKEAEFHRELPFAHGKDYYVLKKYSWLLLKNKADIKYYSQPRFDKRLGRLMNTYDYEEWVLRLDPHFRPIRQLKEKYVAFNRKYAGHPKEAKAAFDDIVDLYASSEYRMFREIAKTLERYREPIINSFILIERIDKDGVLYPSRLSNGPMESLNRIPKDMKRIGRGYLNFDHVRNRFLFSQRKNAAILASPKTLDEIYLKNIEPLR